MSLTPARSASALALHFSLFGRYMRWVRYFCCLCYVWLIVVSLIVRCFLQCRSRSSGSTLVMTFAHLSFVIVHLGILFELSISSSSALSLLLTHVQCDTCILLLLQLIGLFDNSIHQTIQRNTSIESVEQLKERTGLQWLCFFLLLWRRQYFCGT